jgi:hypothetical protein
MAKIIITEQEHLEFTDGTTITSYHEPDCCEYNYADFEQVDDIARNYDFDTSKLRFEKVDGQGFRFGDDKQMFFVPCYSDQNGWYSDRVDIYLNNDFVFELQCSDDYID